MSEQLLERITPPWLRLEVLNPEPIAMTAGSLIDYRLRLRGVRLRFAAFVRRDLERIFDFRRAAVRRLVDERRTG